MDETPDGMLGFNITVSFLSSKIAKITVVSFLSYILLSRNFTVPLNLVFQILKNDFYILV
jgi:hypothetical protein